MVGQASDRTHNWRCDAKRRQRSCRCVQIGDVELAGSEDEGAVEWRRAEKDNEGRGAEGASPLIVLNGELATSISTPHPSVPEKIRRLTFVALSGTISGTRRRGS